MSSRPFVSVVVPCLNRAEFLAPTLESILGQDYPHVECVVVDGGSTDGTVDVLKRFGTRVKWVSEPDEGHADAINKGWRMSRGEILAWLNADDVWEVPRAVSLAVVYFEQHPDVDVVYGDCGSIDANGRVTGMSYLHEWDLDYAVEHCDHCIPQPAAFLRRRAVERVGGLDAAFYQKKDHELWLRIGLTGKIQHIPVLLAHARNIRGLSYEGRSVARACPQVTRKFFSLPGVPERIRAKSRRAMSNSYLRGMQYAFAGGRVWSMVFGYAFLAAVTAPGNTVQAFRDLRLYASQEPDSLFLRAVCRVLGLLGWLGRPFGRLASRGGRPHAPNLLGDREVEWSWVAARMPEGPGQALDFGCGGGDLGLVAAQKGFQVAAVDLGPIEWPYRHSKLSFLQGDILRLELPERNYDLIINCSAIEHVGLSGRYGVKEDRPDGDLEAMRRLTDLMKPGGTMLLTIPVGQDAVFAPLTRIYGAQRLPKLLARFDVAEEQYWVKNAENQWTVADKQAALDFNASAGSWDPKRNIYALGFLVLRKPGPR